MKRAKVKRVTRLDDLSGLDASDRAKEVDPEFAEAVENLSQRDVAERLRADERGEQQPSRSKRAAAARETIDLHGRTTEEAVDLLRAACRRLEGSGATVKVVVGKGNHSADGIGVLSREVPRWIRTDGKRWIADFGSAPGREGGRGALIVRLRTRSAS